MQHAQTFSDLLYLLLTHPTITCLQTTKIQNLTII